MSEVDPFGIVECHYPHDTDEPMVLVTAAAQRVLGRDITTCLVPHLARRVRRIVSPGALGEGPDVATLTLDDGRRICGVRGRRAIVLGVPREEEPDAPDDLAGSGLENHRPQGNRPVQGIDRRSRFRAEFLSTALSDVAGDVALREEAIRLLMLHQLAIDLVREAGAASLAEVYAGDPEMLAALAGPE